MRLNVLIVTKGGHAEGMGDVVSSIVLAEEFRNRYHNISFAINKNKNVIRLIEANRFKYIFFEPQIQLIDFIKKGPIDISILNQLNTPQKEGLFFRRHSKMLVTIDDTGQTVRLADMRFNVLYPIKNSFTDFKYAPLSASFQKKHRTKKIIKEHCTSILIIQGGSDTHGFIPKILKAFYGIPSKIKIKVVIGPQFAYELELRKILSKAPRDFILVKGKRDISSLMLQADLAITAGGFSLLELACLGIPTIVVCAERFEEETAQRLENEGTCINLGFNDDLDQRKLIRTVTALLNDMQLRLCMSRIAKRLVDGYGTKRIVDIILHQCNESRH